MAGPLSTAPWRRAPMLLVRRPVVFVAIFASVVVLGIAAASGVLFVSTLKTASVRAQVAGDCVESAMPQLGTYAEPARTAQANAAAVAALDGVSAPPAPFTVDVAEAEVQSTTITLFARAGATAHVHRLTPDTGTPGAWLPQIFARQHHARPGSVLRTQGGGTLRVAGIYRDIAPDPFKRANLPRYWCTWKALVLQRLDFPTPPLVLTDVPTMAAARPDEVAVTAYDPIPNITVTSATAAEKRMDAAFAAFGTRPTFGTQTPNDRPDPLRDKLDYADRVEQGLLGSVVPIDIAGTVVALLLVLGAGGFWAAHRSREIRLLTSRGVAPAYLGLKAVLETGPAALIGLVVGVVVARLLVQQVGPAADFTPNAFAFACLAAAAAFALALAAIFVIGMRASRETPRARRRMRLAYLVPWELALLAIAVWSAATLRASSGVIVSPTVVTVRPLLTLFPIIGATGALLLLARVVWYLRRPAARLAPRLGHAGFIAVRRMVRAPVVALGLLVGTALPIALLTYAGTVDYGTAREVDAKYRTNLGAPHALLIIGAHAQKPDLHGHGSAVVSYLPSQASLPNGERTSVLGVDTATFDDFAFVDDAQRADVAKLDGDSALFVNAGDEANPTSVRIGSTRVAVHVIARRDVFPGLNAGRFPMIVVNRDRLAHVDPTADRSNIIYTDDAQADAARSALERDGYFIISEVEPAFRLSSTGLQPVTWIFGYLRALAVLIGAVAAAGLVFALAARTRQRTVAYVMSRRMGMRQGVHVRSLLVELGTLVGTGWLGGAVAGAVGYGVIVSALDIYPDLPPGAAFALPASVLVGTGAAVVLVVVLAALATHRMAERADPADVLRLE